MSTSKSSVPTGLELELLTAIQGVPQVFPQGQPIMVDGQPYTIAQLVQSLQGYAANYTSVRVVRVQLHGLVLTKDQSAPGARALLKGIREAAVPLVGANSPSLSKLGFVPTKKAKKLSTDEMAVKVARLRQTRATLHTLGSKQKDALKATTPEVASGSNGKLSIVTPAQGTQAPGVKPV